LKKYKFIALPGALKVVLILCLLFIIGVDLLSPPWALDEYKTFYEVCLFLDLFLIVSFFLEEKYLTAFMGFGFFVALYAGMAVNFAVNPGGVWHFSTNAWDDQEEIRILGLQVMNLGISTFFLLSLLFGGLTNFVPLSDPVAKSKNLPKLVALTLLVLSIPILELTTTGIVSQTKYAGAIAQESIAVKSSGLKVVGIFLVISSLCVACTSSKKISGWFNWFIIGSGVFLMVYYQFLRGERSGSLGYFVVLLIMFFKYSSWGLAKKIVVVPLAGSLLLIVLLAVPSDMLHPKLD
jgi:hypothetical protein